MNYQFPANELYLCLDQGGHASRAIVFNGLGETVCQAYRDLSPSLVSGDKVEYLAADLLHSLQECIDEVLHKLGDARRRLLAAGLATQRSNVVCWDGNSGEALSPIISWQDRRHHRWLKQFQDQAEAIHCDTGLFLSPHYGASKLRWCLDNLPAVQQAYAEKRLRLGPMASYLAQQLGQTEQAYADPVNAARTQLWSLQQHDWDDHLLALFGVPRQCLPTCVPSRHSYGTLHAHDMAIPLSLVTGDQAAAMYAYGQLQPDTAYINMGTGAFISRPSGHAQLYSRRLLTSVILQDDESLDYVLEGTVNGAGSALDWLAREHNTRLDVHTLNTWMQTSEEVPLFLNGVAGLGAPFWIADFASRFIGEGSLQQRAVAVLESIVFLLQASLDEMHKLASPPEQIQVTGGLAHNDGLCQCLADLSQLPVYRPVQCEATARGLAYLLANQPATWPEAEPGHWFEPTYQPKLTERYINWTSQMLNAMRQDAE